MSEKKCLRLNNKQDKEKLRGAWIRNRSTNEEVMITAITSGQVLAGSKLLTTTDLLYNYEWLEGSDICKEDVND